MNGRVYDPFIARFTSSDPNVPDEWNLQSFNRQSYVIGNPMNRTDPSGFDDDGVTKLPRVVYTCDSLCRLLAADGAGGSGVFMGGGPEATAGEGGGGGGGGSGSGGGNGGDDKNSGQSDSGDQANDSAGSEPLASTCNESLVRAGNALAAAASQAADYGAALTGIGLVATGGGFVVGGPVGASPGLAVTSAGGAVSISAGALQFAAGVLQSSGGASNRNMPSAFGTLAFGFGLGRAIRAAAPTDPISSSQRTLSGIANNTAIVSGGTYDAATQFAAQLAPHQASCGSD